MIMHEAIEKLARAVVEYEEAVNEPGPHSMMQLSGLAALQTRLCSLSLIAAPHLRNMLAAPEPGRPEAWQYQSQPMGKAGIIRDNAFVQGSLNLDGDR